MPVNWRSSIHERIELVKHRRSNGIEPQNELSIHRRSGFTLVEMLVVIAIIGLLASMLMPAISTAREAARSAQCISNLKNFGVNMLSHSTQIPGGAYCSGAFDFKRDGVPTEVGWVADMVQFKALAGQMRCPSNPATTSKAIEDLISSPLSDFANSPCFDRLGNPPFTNEVGVKVENISRAIASSLAPPRSPQRLDLIYNKVIDRGYNTNYAATWFLARTEFKLDGNGNIARVDPACGDTDPRGLNVTQGPLKANYLDGAKVPGHAIPLLCDASAVGFLSETIGGGTLNEIPAGSMYVTPLVGVPIGNRLLIDTDLDGNSDLPSPFYLKTPLFAVPTSRKGTTGWLKTWNFDTRQDYRALQPIHSGVANVLMADGSVQSLYDTNGDGFINNGFDPSPPGGQLYWQSKQLEVDESRLATYYSLKSKGPTL